MAGGLIIWAYSALIPMTSPAAPPPGSVGRASLLLLILAILMGVLLLTIALMTVTRRVRRRAISQTVSPSKPLADPWQESANRVRVKPQRPKPPTDEDEDED